jgi:hypothetical protein
LELGGNFGGVLSLEEPLKEGGLSTRGDNGIIPGFGLHIVCLFDVLQLP